MGSKPIDRLTPARTRLLKAWNRLNLDNPSIRVLAREQKQSLGATTAGVTMLVRLGYAEKMPKPGRGYRLTKKGQS